MSRREIYGNGDLFVTYIQSQKSESSSVVICFSPFNTRSRSNNEKLENFFSREGNDVISIVNLKDDWYQNVGEDVIGLIQAEIARLGKRVILYGSSMGGYAAFAFSALFRSDMVIAYSPQIAINSDFDRRWADYATKLEWQYLVSERSITSNCQYICFFDPKNTDVKHIDGFRRLISPERLTLVELPYSGHPSTVYLGELGILKDIALKALSGKQIDNDLMRNRRNSVQWLHEVAKALYSKNRFAQSLLFIDKALLLRSTDIAIMRLRVNALVKLGRYEEARLQGELILAAGDVSFQRYFDWLVDKNLSAN
jgi:pimeloyl-ACP methyl ester carboxylesterase